MSKWYYEGPVQMFGHTICSKFTSQTTAPSEAKARSNLGYQFKKQYGKAAEAKITLPGKLRQIG